MTDAVRHDPVTDLDRLAEIAGLDLFSGRAKATLDAFARRAAERFGMPIGLVTVVLNDSQFLAGTHGITGWMAEAEGTPVEWSFCVTSVRTRAAYVVPDARTDAVQWDNPLVTVDGIVSYAGTPLVTSRGHVLGNHCVLGGAPREFTPQEVAELQQMADEVVAEIERTRMSACTGPAELTLGG